MKINDKKFSVYIHKAPSGKVYVGITCRKPEYRWGNGNNYKGNKHFYNAILKYDWDNIIHQVLFNNLEKEMAEKIEVKLIQLYNANDRMFGYNKSIGGEAHALGFRHTEETKRIIGEKSRIYGKGKKMSKEARIKMSKARLGKPMKQETIVKKSKPIICVETKIVYYGEHYAEEKTKISSKNINSVLKGRRKTAGGYHWRYYYESD